MMIYSLCNTCLQPYRLILQTQDLSLLKQIASEDGQTCKCPRLCGGLINLMGDATIAAMASDKRLKEPLSITGKELFQAINGMGLPDEVHNDPSTVDAFLRSNKIVRIRTEDYNGRLYLHELQLENGVTLHLGAGGRGAQIVKMTKERTHGSPSPG